MGRASAAVLVLALATTVLIASGCASAKVTDWTGHHIDEVINKFGKPTRIVPAAEGAKMYVFEYQRSFANPSWGPGGTVSANERRCTANRTFFVRADGIVGSWSIHDCTP